MQRDVESLTKIGLGLMLLTEVNLHRPATIHAQEPPPTPTAAPLLPTVYSFWEGNTLVDVAGPNQIRTTKVCPGG